MAGYKLPYLYAAPRYAGSIFICIVDEKQAFCRFVHCWILFHSTFRLLQRGKYTEKEREMLCSLCAGEQRAKEPFSHSGVFFLLSKPTLFMQFSQRMVFNKANVTVHENSLLRAVDANGRH